MVFESLKPEQSIPGFFLDYWIEMKDRLVAATVARVGARVSVAGNQFQIFHLEYRRVLQQGNAVHYVTDSSHFVVVSF